MFTLCLPAAIHLVWHLCLSCFYFSGKSSGLGPTVDFGFPHKKMRLDFKDPATMSSLPEFPNRLSPPAEPSRDSDSPMRIDLLELHLAEAKQQVKALNAELDEKNAEIRSKKAEITFKDERIRLNESLIGLQRNANVFSFAPMQHFPAPKPTKQPIYINDPAAPRWKGPEELRDAILRRMRWTVSPHRMLLPLPRSIISNLCLSIGVLQRAR